MLRLQRPIPHNTYCIVMIMKRLHSFMLQRFVPLLAMTFFISLFILMMQFLWKYIEDLVGKGLDFSVICELFFYAALTMVPMALPLAVLLASLMTFGNLGEKLELTAMKAAGISLFRIMRPLIVLMVFVSIGAFFFQNNVLPVAQTKMWTLLFSMRQKSPELEIPEKSFYSDIPDMNIYVERKDRNTGMLHDIIIYDVSRGIDNSRIILADSAKMMFTQDKTLLFLHLYHGELFENFTDNSLGGNNRGFMPFRRESFDDKQVYFPFDANFNRLNEQGIRSQYVGMNISELSHAIDSIQAKVDSIGQVFGTELKETPYLGLPYYTQRYVNHKLERIARPPVHPSRPINVDSVFARPNASMARSYISQALTKVQRVRNEYEFKSTVLLDQEKSMRKHDIEMQKKFTLSIACIIFFFIGAPLGAIVKKGGIGTPLVLSVLLFIVYFIFDNSGYKMARDGKTAVWFGIWLSTMVMTPLGIFFTYKAVGDTSMLDFDWLRKLNEKIKRPSQLMRLFARDSRNLETKEYTFDDVVPSEIVPRLQALITAYRNISGTKVPWYSPKVLRNTTAPIAPELESVVEYLHNSKDIYIIHLLNEIPLRVRRRDIPSVIKTLKSLISRLNGEDTESEKTPISTENTEASENPEDVENVETSENSDTPTLQ